MRSTARLIVSWVSPRVLSTAAPSRAKVNTLQTPQPRVTASRRTPARMNLVRRLRTFMATSRVGLTLQRRHIPCADASHRDEHSLKAEEWHSACLFLSKTPAGQVVLSVRQ